MNTLSSITGLAWLAARQKIQTAWPKVYPHSQVLSNLYIQDKLKYRVVSTWSLGDYSPGISSLIWGIMTEGWTVLSLLRDAPLALGWIRPAPCVVLGLVQSPFLNLYCYREGLHKSGPSQMGNSQLLEHLWPLYLSPLFLVLGSFTHCLVFCIASFLKSTRRPHIQRVLVKWQYCTKGHVSFLMWVWLKAGYQDSS